MRRWGRNHAVPLPPEPPKGKCRWCLACTIEAAPGFIVCPSGCEQEPTTTEHRCGSCHGLYRTGRPLGKSDRCWECEQEELEAMRLQTQAEGTPLRGFLADEVSRGANRRAMEQG